MPNSYPAPSVLRSTLLAATLAAPLLACAPAPDANMSGSSVPPASSASTASGDIAGAGGPLDDTYRQIYTPGDPRWSNEY